MSTRELRYRECELRADIVLVLIDHLDDELVLRWVAREDTRNHDKRLFHFFHLLVKLCRAPGCLWTC